MFVPQPSTSEVYVHGEHLGSLRLSFVAHSIGCIVVRAALLQPPLQQFRPRLGTFVSLCGPHLGLARANNALLTSGMRILQHMKQAKWIAQALLEDKREAIGYNRIITDSHIAKISVVGVGMKSHAGVASDMFRALADRGINIQAITTSEIKVSVMIDEDETELAVRVLHTAYGLDAEDAA